MYVVPVRLTLQLISKVALPETQGYTPSTYTIILYMHPQEDS